MINNEALLPPSLSACPGGQYSHYRANLQHKYQSWIYNVEYEDDTVVNDGWDQIIHDPGSSTARWRTLCGKERSEDCILSYISTSWSSCSPVMHFGHNFLHLWSSVLSIFMHLEEQETFVGQNQIQFLLRHMMARTTPSATGCSFLQIQNLILFWSNFKHSRLFQLHQIVTSQV